jgi:uncharacterized protein YjbJ (UPF0337 family)
MKEEVSVPSRSSREDKNEGAMDRAKGHMKEAGGALTGDKSKKREGRSDPEEGQGQGEEGQPQRPTLVVNGFCGRAGVLRGTGLIHA